MYILSVRAKLRKAQDLFMALYSRITSGRVQGTIEELNPGGLCARHHSACYTVAPTHGSGII